MRAVFTDLDGAPLDPVIAEISLQPHIITETSPERWHAYWRVDPDPPIEGAGADAKKTMLEQFSKVQKAIAARYSGDSSVHDLPRVMRLPGFVHRKGEPFVSRVIKINGLEPCYWNKVVQAFPPPPQPEQPTRSAAQEEVRDQWRKLNDEAIRRYSDWVPDIFPAASSNGKGGYRVLSVDLGRDLEEDLSFHAEGIKDFGVHDMGDARGGSRKPIDIVEQYLNKDFNAAVDWLAQKLGLDANDYLPKPKPKPNGKCSGDPATDAQLARLAKLSAVQSDRERVAAAEKLRLRYPTLGKLVANERAKQAFAEAKPEKAEQERAAKTETERVLAELNRDNAVVLDGARTRVLRFEEVEHDAGGEHCVYRVPTFLRFEDLRNLHLNRRIAVWAAQHPGEQAAVAIVFMPACTPH